MIGEGGREGGREGVPFCCCVLTSRIFRKASTRSCLALQHIHPLGSSTTSASFLASPLRFEDEDEEGREGGLEGRRASSMLTEPNSFSMTARRLPWAERRM